MTNNEMALLDCVAGRGISILGLLCDTYDYCSVPQPSLDDEATIAWVHTSMATGLLEGRLEGKKIIQLPRDILEAHYNNRENILIDGKIRAPYPHNFFLFLTQKGGELWERQFSADWNRYYQYCESPPSGCQQSRRYPGRKEGLYASINHCVIETINKNLLMEQYEWIVAKGFECRLIKQCEEISPWRPRHWKILPVVYQCRLEYIVPNWSKNQNIFDFRYRTPQWRKMWAGSIEEGLIEPEEYQHRLVSGLI